MQNRVYRTRTGCMVPVVILAAIALLCIPATATVAFTTSVPQTLAKGDTFTISGTGAQNGSVIVWVIGRNYFDTITTVPDTNGNFTLALLPDETSRFSSGQYAVVIQDPGTNGRPEIGYRVDDAGNISFLNRQAIFADIGPKQGIKANAEPVVRILLEGAALPGTDDILTPYYFFIEEPSVNFDRGSATGPDGQLPNVTVGERITISGTTNMGVENLLHADLRNLDTNSLIGSRTIPVTARDRLNQWSFELDTADLLPGEYFVTVGWMKSNTTGTGSALVHVVPESGSNAVHPFNGRLASFAGGLSLPVIVGGTVLFGVGCILIVLQKKKI